MKNIIHSYLDHSSWNLKENSNFQYNYHSLRNYIASDIIKNYWLKNVFSEKECDRHLSGDFHIHDLDNLCPYCIGWNTSTILHNKKKASFKTIENVFDTLFVFLDQMSHEWTGAQSLNGFDVALLPYIKTSDKFKKILFTQVKSFFTRINSATPLGKALFVNLGLKLYDKTHNKKELIGISEEFMNEDKTERYLQLNYKVELQSKPKITLSSEHVVYDWTTKDDPKLDAFLKEIVKQWEIHK